MDSVPGTSKTVRAMDSNFEEVVSRWLEETEEEFSDGDVTEHDSVSELEVSDNDKEILDSENDATASRNANSNAIDYFGKNLSKWSSESFVSRSRTPKHNIIVQLSGLRPSAKLLGN